MFDANSKGGYYDPIGTPPYQEKYHSENANVIEYTIGVPHYTSNISENTRKNGCVIIEGAPHENKMAGKGQITSERTSS
jgi:hypothetical protein